MVLNTNKHIHSNNSHSLYWTTHAQQCCSPFRMAMSSTVWGILLSLRNVSTALQAWDTRSKYAFTACLPAIVTWSVSLVETTSSLLRMHQLICPFNRGRAGVWLWCDFGFDTGPGHPICYMLKIDLITGRPRHLQITEYLEESHENTGRINEFT